MSGGIFLIQPDESLVEMSEQPYDSESVLQLLLAKYPNLLAGDQMDSASPRRWLLIKREMGIPSKEDGYNRWSIDHLFVDQDAIPTLIEVKRSTDTRIRREVVGQMLDYAANAVVYWPVEQLRADFEVRCEQTGLNADQLVNELVQGTIQSDEFWGRIKTNLQAGKVRLIFVADEIPTELRRIIEFLNKQMEPAEVLAVEIKQYVGQSMKTLVPRVIGQTAEAVTKKRVAVEQTFWTEDAFFAEVARSHPTILSRQSDLLSRLRKIPEISIQFDLSKKHPTYKVWLVTPESDFLSVFGTGRIYVRWGMLRKVAGEQYAKLLQDIWRPLAPVDEEPGVPKFDGAMPKDGLDKLSPEVVAEKVKEFVKQAAKEWASSYHDKS